MRKILIVDDVKTNRMLLGKMLEAEYSILEAASGEEALELLRREYGTISAVLLDIGLPGIDGYEVLRIIRSDKKLKPLPVIMITANEDEASRVKALSLDADDFVMKPYNFEVIRHCLLNNIAISEASGKSRARIRNPKNKLSLYPALNIKNAALIACAAALILSLCIQHFSLQRDLKKTCGNVAVDFSEIMDSYRHSFSMFELLLQQEIKHSESPDKIEAFLKTQDSRLLAIEGGDYDGVYMYYQGRYLYSWNTPSSAYEDTGYDATKRPWYIGAVAARGDIFFSTPYPSYANDYMLATISRLQPDGETVIAYDIKLGEISSFVNRLNLYNGALALICDAEGRIIGSSIPLYLGGNYTLSAAELGKAVSAARLEVEKGGPMSAAAEKALKSAEAQEQFISKNGAYLASLRTHGSVCYSLRGFSFGYAYTLDGYTCFVMASMTTMLPQLITLWAAISFACIILSLLIGKMLRRNHQILSDALTGLNNRRAFMKYCDNHIQHHADETLGLLMLDLNHFKKINDLFGHATGDRALLDTAAVLKSACGDSPDNYFLCRYGGDEFLLAGRVADADALHSMSELIADGFKRKNQTSVTPYVLEASMGVAFGMCADRNGVESLLTQADKAMYDAKRDSEQLR